MVCHQVVCPRTIVSAAQSCCCWLWPDVVDLTGAPAVSDHGHSFWDTETWQYPPLLLLNPGIAGSLLDYRFNRIHQALVRF